MFVSKLDINFQSITVARNKNYNLKEDQNMKATGIVRRIDDLGRVVIPKEIRRTMRIREGDPLEIYTEKDGEVIFKKYSPVGGLADFALHIVESLNKTTGCCVAICDRDTVISISGVSKRELNDKPISMELEKIMESRQIYHRRKEDKGIPFCETNDKYNIAIAAPIIAEGDVMGCVVFFDENNQLLGEVEYKLAQTVSGFLGKQMEG